VSGVTEALQLALERGETGVQVAAYLGEELIVDAWAGEADPRTGRPVDGDTLFAIFSVAKGATSTAVHLQAERGLLDYADPIAKHWPEFGANGKLEATIEQALSHRLGLPQMPEDLTPERLSDWDGIVTWLAAQEPLTAPGTVSSYHPMSFGFVLGEVVRRTDPQRRPFGQFLREEICEPLGLDDLYLGVPEGALARVAPLSLDPPPGDIVLPPERVAFRAKTVPPNVELVPEVYNRADVLQACIPATGLTTNARSLARLYALHANGGQLGGVRLLSPERVRSFTTPREDYDAIDQTNFRVMPVGARGFWISDPVAGSGPGIICNVGAGGAVAWADLDSGLAVAITHNRLFAGVPIESHPLKPIADAVRAVAAQRAPAYLAN
jgi:CubicO group peptidase (beta-lactamase class C family)